MRRLVVAILFFAVAVGMVVWVVSKVILNDLSEGYVRGVLTQAQGETEGFLRAYYETEEGSEGEIVDGDAVMAECLLGFKRAGCDGILTYAAIDVARGL